jgi:hypothetical protein
VRQSMVVDLDQFCAAPELPEVERGYVRAVEPMSEEEVRAVVVAAIHDDELESPFALAHDEDIGGWSARIAWWRLMGFWSIVEVTGLAPVEVLLELLLRELLIAFGASGAIGFGADWGTEEKFYRKDTYFFYYCKHLNGTAYPAKAVPLRCLLLN